VPVPRRDLPDAATAVVVWSDGGCCQAHSGDRHRTADFWGL